MFSTFILPVFFLDLREISLTSCYGILVESKIIILNLTNGKTFTYEQPV